MKKQIINLGVIVPSRHSSWGYDEAGKEAWVKFCADLSKALGLPENWSKYFRLNRTDDFVILTNNESYNATIFRKFGRNKEATVTTEILQNLKDHVDEVNNSNMQRTREEQRREYFKGLLDEVTNKINSESDKWHLFYSNEGDGLNLGMLGMKKSRWRDEMESYEVARIYIKHSGEIVPPSFSTPYNFKYSTTIEDAKKFVSDNQSIYDEIMAKASEIKDQLPKEYFELDQYISTQLSQEINHH